MAFDMQEPPRILGIPTKDGAYWYFEFGKPLPTMVVAFEHRGQRTIRTGDGAVQRWWKDGEFFVGPIEPPFATPASIANPADDVYKAALENMRWTDGRMGIDGSRHWVPPERTVE